MRVLVYNWVDYLDDEKRGGGVTVYTRNLVQGLAAHISVRPAFLAAGVSHDLVARSPRWERLRHGPPATRPEHYEIVNSGVVAPAHFSFGDPAQLRHGPTEQVFYDFLAATGPYDVVHFNNLEGLPAAVLALKAMAPDTRVILTLHNYYPFCGQVNLWRRERMLCEDFDQGRACTDCLTARYDSRVMRKAYGLDYRLKLAGLRPGSRGFDPVLRWFRGFGRRVVRLLGVLRRVRSVSVPPPDGRMHVARRAEMVALINAHCDRVLCVSEAVREVALRYGIAPDLAETRYIGTAEAAAVAHTAPRPLPAPDAPLTLAFLGYMRRDKGFYFLLDALEALPDDVCRRLRLVVAARAADRATMARIDRLGRRLAGVVHFDGYSHNDLDNLLADVDVGVIPVLWHDNLPQVATEMHARQIPLLCSDRGGAKELGRCPELVFPAGDIAAFHARLRALLAGEVDIGAYWRGARPPMAMDRHIEELLAIYDQPARR